MRRRRRLARGRAVGTRRGTAMADRRRGGRHALAAQNGQRPPVRVRGSRVTKDARIERAWRTRRDRRGGAEQAGLASGAGARTTGPARPPRQPCARSAAGTTGPPTAPADGPVGPRPSWCDAPPSFDADVTRSEPLHRLACPCHRPAFPEIPSRAPSGRQAAACRVRGKAPNLAGPAAAGDVAARPVAPRLPARERDRVRRG